jgi:DNA-binding IclR family transcriptional regulator
MVEANVDGTQAIRRAAAILRLIGQGSSQGIGLAAITKALNLPRSTAHRILKCLVEEGLVGHEPEKRRYVVGQLTYELGLTVTPDVLEITKWRAAVDRVAIRTGATSYLMSRSGMEVVCVHKAEGRSVIRAIPVEVGQRRFLGVGAGSTALLAALDDETVDRVLDAILPAIGDYPGLDEQTIRQIIERTRSTGFAVSVGTVYQDVVGIGRAIPKAGGPPSLAVTIAALASQANDRVVESWKQIMIEEIATVLQAGDSKARLETV